MVAVLAISVQGKNNYLNNTYNQQIYLPFVSQIFKV